MSQSKVHHFFSFETEHRRLRNLMSRFLCTFVFSNRNALVLMSLWLFSLITRTLVCMHHFRRTTRSFELIWLMISRFSRSFLWNVYKSCRILRNFVFVWDFATSFTAKWFRFFLSSFWFRFVSQSSRNIWSREFKIRICQCQLADLRRADAAIFFWHVLCVLFWNCYRWKYRRCKRKQNHRNNQRIRRSYNADTWRIRCTDRTTILDIYMRRIWFWTSWDFLIQRLLFECDEMLVECLTWWNILFFSNASKFRQWVIMSICFFLIN